MWMRRSASNVTRLFYAAKNCKNSKKISFTQSTSIEDKMKINFNVRISKEKKRIFRVNLLQSSRQDILFVKFRN